MLFPDSWKCATFCKDNVLQYFVLYSAGTVVSEFISRPTFFNTDMYFFKVFISLPSKHYQHRLKADVFHSITVCPCFLGRT
jgi:hypothetical protein